MQAYGLDWNNTSDMAQVEASMCRSGGYVEIGGKKYGNGYEHHFKELIKLLAPWFSWHIYSNLIVDSWCKYDNIGIAGPASCSKTFSLAMCVYAEFFINPRGTSIIMSSTTLEGLKLRVWGAMVEILGKVQERRPWAPGYLVASERRIYPTPPTEEELRDPRDAIMGIACKVGDSWVGLGCFPAGTLVDTPTGSITIESVSVGDRVANAIGYGFVTNKMSRLANSLVKISLGNGGSIVCTENHKIFTTVGWVNAVDITTESVLLSPHESMQILREGLVRKAKERDLLRQEVQGQGEVHEGSVLQDVWNSACKGYRSEEVLFRTVQKKELGKTMPELWEDVYTNRTESCVLFSELLSECELEGGWICSEGCEWERLCDDGIEGKRNYHGKSRGKRETCESCKKQGWYDSVSFVKEKLGDKKEIGAKGIRESWVGWGRNGSGDFICKTFQGCGTGVCYQVEPFTQERISTLVQSRLRIHRYETSSRDRWGKPREGESKASGCEKRGELKGVRVVSVEVHKPASLGYSTDSKGYCVVHNLEVSGHPSYSVSGVLVHNSFVGLKNDRVIGVFDEASLMPRVFWDSTANLRKNPKTKFIACGNPKDHTDAHGVICEPHQEIGGWEGLPYSERTRTWKARGTNSIALQLSGYDSPNYNYPRGTNPYPYLITPEQMEDDAARYGKDSWQYLMQNVGVWPMGASSRRVITRAMCEKGKAFDKPVWLDDARVHVLGLDAAYSGAGGDRTPLVHLEFGRDMNGHQIISFVEEPLIIPGNPQLRDEEGRLVPIEDQISRYVMEYAKKNNIPPSKFGFDSTGRGSLALAMSRIWGADIVAIEFGGKPKDRNAFQDRDELESELYGKMVTALWFAVANVISSGQMRNLPTSVYEEGTMREWMHSGGKKAEGRIIDVESKRETIKRMGRSPDLFDALVCAIEVARRNGFNIGAENTATRRLGKPWWLKKRDDWLKTVNKQVLA